MYHPGTRHCTAVHTPAHSSILQQTLVQTTSSNKNITLYFTRIQPFIKVYTSVSNYSSHQWVPRDTHHTSLLIIHPLISSGKKRMQRQTEVLHKWRTRDRAVWTVVVSMSRVQAHCFCRCCDTHVSTTPTYHHPVRSTNNCFFFILSLPQQNRYVCFDTKVNVCFDLMCDVRSKTSSHNAVPMGSILFVKMWSNHGRCFFVWSTGHSVAGWLKRIFGCFDGFVHHFVRHVFGIDDGFFIGHCWEKLC